MCLNRNDEDGIFYQQKQNSKPGHCPAEESRLLRGKSAAAANRGPLPWRFRPAAIFRRPESPHDAAAQGDLHLEQFVSTKSP